MYTDILSQMKSLESLKEFFRTKKNLTWDDLKIICDFQKQIDNLHVNLHAMGQLKWSQRIK